MPRLPKCKLCGEPIEDKATQSVPYKNGYAHRKCFDLGMKVLTQDKKEKLNEKTKQKQKKPQIELKEKVTEEDYAEKKKYYSYLRNLLERNGEEISAKIYAVTDQYIKRYDFDYKGLYDTLYYLYEITEKDLKGDIVGIIPYYYTEAKKYFESVEQIKRNNSGKKIRNETKVIVIHPQQRKQKIYKDVLMAESEE